jgi:hypothetical protein
MKGLTLKECLEQDRGYEGRLFEIDGPGIGYHDSHVYRVIELSRGIMNVESYVVGCILEEIRDVPISERLQDRVMDSDHLLEWYRMAGRAGIAGIF